MGLPDHLAQLAARVSNWGRWGETDQRGTLNLVTPEATRRGVASVRDGTTWSLAIPFDQHGPQWDSVNMPERVNPELRTYAVNVSFTGDPDDFTTSDDVFRMGSQAATHWDALGHVGYSGRLWNDTPMDVISGDGADRLGIEHYGPVATRGVLLDIARLHGVDHFDHAYPITADDLQRAADGAGVTVAAGDAVLVRTGQMAHLRAADKRRYSMPSPGFGTASIEWIRDHDVAAVATDTMTFECYPCEDPAVFMPVQMILMRDVGLALGQNWHLDALAEACATDGRATFLLVASPLPLTGAVGAPVVPTAIR
ncbi:MAG TPA: cyclase family protein [Acidimicrobiia bacterium]|nr:cyclase family protein [Acidimicrobiia bacterium]